MAEATARCGDGKERLSSARVLRDLGLRIGELRGGRGFTQEMLAERLKVTARWLQSVEAGKENLTIGTMVRFANALKVAMTQFLTPPTMVSRKPGRPRRSS
ncbi:MAG TPA: helix-turn-helix transcriptional regulator [Polyangiaceae bacterium]